MSAINSEEQMEIKSQINQLNKEIVAAHDKHYESSSTGLWKPNESPNGNTMFHLYSDGEVTYQKGGWAYGKRSVFPFQFPISGMVQLGFVFPKKHEEVKETYVILTEKECYDFRDKMIKMFNEFNKK
jgi:hypothetical protein